MSTFQPQAQEPSLWKHHFSHPEAQCPEEGPASGSVKFQAAHPHVPPTHPCQYMGSDLITGSRRVFHFPGYTASTQNRQHGALPVGPPSVLTVPEVSDSLFTLGHLSFYASKSSSKECLLVCVLPRPQFLPRWSLSPLSAQSGRHFSQTGPGRLCDHRLHGHWRPRGVTRPRPAGLRAARARPERVLAPALLCRASRWGSPARWPPAGPAANPAPRTIEFQAERVARWAGSEK